MMDLRLTDRARQDLRELWTYVARDNGVTVADAQLDRVFEAFKTLCSFPDAGRSRPELRPGLRSYAVSPFVVFYAVDEEGISVLNVVHGSRDLPRLLE